jgi:two-component system nitrogen regulation response regulator GlnG
VPVLARGETGSGKEMIAEALHKASERASGPFVAVSLAALVATTAASELFGHRRGAFTGAHADHDGHFVRANGGTLFLDEVGEASLELQAMLLRVLETREVLPVGGARAERVDVRLISATDADLEHACSEGSFREALYHRLAGCQIRIPPLRERREDITLLFVHFLRSELSALGAEARLDPAMTAERPWLAASIVARLVRYAWPGNVRQVRNVARQIALANRQLEQVELPHAVRETLDAGRVAAAASALVPATRKAPSEITEDELVAALRANSWSPGATAAQLGIARNSLYALIDRATTVRKARDVDRDELARSYEACGGDVDAMAVQLEISARALKLRLRELGLDKP